jgi:hypothetical protein
MSITLIGTTRPDDAEALDLGALGIDTTSATDDPDFGPREAAYSVLVYATRSIARKLISDLTGRGPVDRPDVDAPIDRLPRTQKLDDELDALIETLAGPRSQLSGLPASDRRVLFEIAAEDVGRMALEEFDLWSELTQDRDRLELQAVPVSPALGSVLLLDRLFDQADGIALQLGDPLLEAERLACAWAFRRWNTRPPRQLMPVAIADLRAEIREIELATVDYRTTALGTSLLEHLCESPAFADVHPRLNVLAQQVRLSFPDILECVSADGTRATWRSVTTDNSYEVEEHELPHPYHRGWIGIGRVIPGDDKDSYFLRSPGMLLFPPAQYGSLAKAALESFDEYCKTLPEALALEAAISSAALGARVPHDTQPASSRKAAREMLDELEPEIEGLELSETLTEYLAALRKQAAATGTRRNRS